MIADGWQIPLVAAPIVVALAFGMRWFVNRPVDPEDAEKEL